MQYTKCTITGKLRFPTEPVAKLELMRAQRLHTAQGRSKIEKRYFPCDCGGLHLTSWSSQHER